jgi:type I restriction enzyme S subunit
VLRLEAAARVDDSEFRRQTERRTPEPGDIVYSRELSYGWAVVVPDGASLCLSQGMVLLRPDDRLSSEFIAMVLNSRVGRSQAKAAATGSAHPHINLRDIRNYRMPVPPRQVQEAILAEVDSIHDAASAVEMAVQSSQRRATLLRSAILARAFRGESVAQDSNDEPATVLLEGIAVAQAGAPKPRRKRRENTAS